VRVVEGCILEKESKWYSAAKREYREQWYSERDRVCDFAQC
jgi:hypothetical protein